MIEGFRSNPFDEESKEDESKPEDPQRLITEEHLISESGRLNSERILELEQKFRDKLKIVVKGEYDMEDTEAYYEAITEMDNAFDEAATVLLNTLEHLKGHVVTGVIFHNLNRLLRKASEYSSDIYSLYGVYDRIIKNFPRLEARLNEGGVEPIEAVTLISKSEVDKQRIEAIGFLVKQLPAIDRYLKVETSLGYSVNVDQVYPALLVLLENSTETTKQNVLSMVKQLTADPETCPEGAWIIGNMLDYKLSPKTVSDEAVKIVQDVLLYHGIDEDTADQWIKEWASSGDTKALFVRKNLEAFINLEYNEPGVTKYLSDKYGITAFGRYPAGMLLEQKANVANQERPYGIVLYPKDDWNGAFHQDEGIFGNLRSRLKDDPNLQKYLLRVYECGSKKDIAKALIDLDKSYGASHKIAFAIIGGHGTKESINFGGGSSPRNQLYSKDLHRSRVQKTGEFFEPEATIVLVSCSTGQNEGVGQTLTEKIGMKVIAPTVPTNVRKIIPRFVNGRIDFDVEYTEKDTAVIYARTKTSKPAEGFKAE